MKITSILLFLITFGLASGPGWWQRYSDNGVNSEATRLAFTYGYNSPEFNSRLEGYVQWRGLTIPPDAPRVRINPGPNGGDHGKGGGGGGNGNVGGNGGDCAGQVEECHHDND